MPLIHAAYRRVLDLMAGLAGLLMVAMMVSIVVDVVLRNAGWQSSAHLFTFNEYFLFLIPLLGAPLLIREKGHVYVEILLMSVTPALRRRLVVLVLVLSTLACAVLAWFSFELLVSDIVRGEKDARSLDLPRWILTLFLPLSFTMMTLEFARFLRTGEDPFEKTGGEAR